MRRGEKFKIKNGESISNKKQPTYMKNRSKENRKCKGNYRRNILSRTQGHAYCKTRGNFIEQSFKLYIKTLLMP